MTFTYTIDRSPEFVFEQLSTIEKFVAIHPVIKKMVHLGEDRYLVSETLNFMGVPVSFKYPATVNSDPESATVTMTATVMRINKVKMNFFITEQDSLCHIREELEFSAPWPLRSGMENIFKKQHAQLFENMRKLGIDQTK